MAPCQVQERVPPTGGVRQRQSRAAVQDAAARAPLRLQARRGCTSSADAATTSTPLAAKGMPAASPVSCACDELPVRAKISGPWSDRDRSGLTTRRSAASVRSGPHHIRVLVPSRQRSVTTRSRRGERTYPIGQVSVCKRTRGNCASVPDRYQPVVIIAKVRTAPGRIPSWSDHAVRTLAQRDLARRFERSSGQDRSRATRGRRGERTPQGVGRSRCSNLRARTVRTFAITTSLNMDRVTQQVKSSTCTSILISKPHVRRHQFFSPWECLWALRTIAGALMTRGTFASRTRRLLRSALISATPWWRGLGAHRHLTFCPRLNSWQPHLRAILPRCDCQGIRLSCSGRRSP